MYKIELRPSLWHWSLSHRYIVPIFHNAFIFVEETAIYMSLLRTHTPAGRYDDKHRLWTLTNENNRPSSRFLVDRLYPIRGSGDALSHPLIQLKSSPKSSYDSLISTEAISILLICGTRSVHIIISHSFVHFWLKNLLRAKRAENFEAWNVQCTLFLPHRPKCITTIIM